MGDMRIFRNELECLGNIQDCLEIMRNIQECRRHDLGIFRNDPGMTYEWLRSILECLGSIEMGARAFGVQS